MKVNNYGLLLTILIYIIVVFISIAMFGSNISSVILENIGTSSFTKNGVTHYYWEGYVCNIIFLILLSCHIPVIFFFGKEGLLIIIDEIDRKSISNAL
jgi:amino acid permease